MAFDRVKGLGPVAPMPALARPPGPSEGPGARPASLRADDVLKLEVSQSFEGELLMSSPAGQRFRLRSERLAGLPLEPGQVLSVKVLATSPQLELALLDRLGDTLPPPGSPPGSAQALPDTLPSPALQTDQAAMRRFAQPLPDALTLARRWLALAVQALNQQQQADTLGPAFAADGGAHSPTAPTAPEGLAGLRPGPQGEAIPMASDALLPQVQQPLLLWQTQSPQGLPLTFCLWQPGRGGPVARAADTPLGLRMRMLLRHPQGGLVLIDLALSPPGVVLTLSTDQAARVAGLRGRLSLLAARLACAGLRLMRCHVLYSALPGFATPAPSAHLALARLPMPPALFRAAAEALVVLSPPFR